MKILVVDDHELNRKLLRAVLHGEGHVTVDAADGIEALGVLAREPVDAVISDILMPHMDGYRLCYEVRRSEKLRALPFIFYTATYTSAGDEKLCLELGGDKYLRKPAEPEAIVAALDEVMQAGAHRAASGSTSDESSVLRRYSESLVVKLGEKNAELSEALTSLKTSEQRLQTIIDTEPECVKVISLEGLIVDMNRAGLAMFGADSIEQLRGRPIVDLIAPEHRAALERLHARVFAGGSGMLTFETIGLNGQRRWLETHSVPLLVGGRISALLSIARDVSEARRAEAALRVSERRYQRLAGSNVIGVMIATVDGRVVEANDCLLTMLGYTHAAFEAASLGWDDLTPPEWSAVDRQAMSALREHGVCAPFDKEYLRRDGSRIPVQVTIVAPDDAAAEYLCLVVDISQRKRADAELQRLSGRLLQAQDEERRRLARELHDSTAQVCAAVGMNLAVLARGAARFTAEQRELLAECEALAQRATNELRTTAYLLHPPALDTLGLVRAIEDYARGFAVRSGMQVQLELPPSGALGRLPDAIELSLFRVVQESLGNAWRHAGGKSIAIRIERDAAHVELDVRDDGCGPLMPNGNAGVGIAGMRERLRLLGGQLEIEAAEPGTRVRARLPLMEIAS